ncbi:hypothetical protein BDY24DRAFT_392698 [Mrakia frigida]|uniref:uncharacterized protein n=1 Tax=Mrakia frigida TaxID=29902 RepID=UPI003FCC0AA2
MESSYDHVAVRQHGYQSSSASDSIFHSTEESFNRSFAIKPLRPISGVSIVSSSEDSGELNEDDTFAFKRSSAPSTQQNPSVRVLALQEKPLPARPVSVLSTNSSLVGPDDTFAFKQSRAPPLPFSLPKLLPNERRKVAAPQASPLRIKRKAVPRADEEASPRKARLVDGSSRSSAETLRSFKMPTKGMRERPSLEESVLIGEGEDLSFSSQELSTSEALGSSTNTSSSSSNSRKVNKPRAPLRNKNNGRSRPSTLVFSPAPPDTPPMTSPSASESSYAQSNRSSLDLNLLVVSLASNSGVTTRSRTRNQGAGHRRRTSGAAGPVVVQATIHEERSLNSLRDLNSSPPGLSRSPSPPSTGSLDSSFPSPVFIHGREPDIAAYDDDPDAMEAMRGWHEWERDAKYEHTKSVAEWKDTEFSMALMANFQPPTKAKAVKKFVEHSNKTYLSLPLASPSHSTLLKHRRSSSLTDSRQLASPYFSSLPANKSLAVPLKLKSKRPSPLPTKFGGSSPLLASFPPAPPSAKFALFARERAPSPPPTLDIIVPGSPLKVPWVESGSGETTKKARRVSSDVRRSKLGWGRRKTSDGPGSLAKNVEVVAVRVQDSATALLKLEGGASKKRGSVFEDKPSRNSQSGLPSVPYKASNKENVYNDLTVRPTRSTTRSTSSHIPRPIRA